MAVGDDAKAVGWPVVSASDGTAPSFVKNGYEEINRSRDFAAQVKLSIDAVWPLSKGGTGGTNPPTARTNLGIRSGSADPTGGADGDIYFKIVG